MKVRIALFIALFAALVSCQKNGGEESNDTSKDVSIIGTWQSYYYYEVEFSHVVGGEKDDGTFTVTFSANKAIISGYGGGDIEGYWEFDKEDTNAIVFPYKLTDTNGESYLAAARLDNTTLQIQICNIYDDIISGYYCYKVK